MIKLEHTQVYNWEGAIRGMRNPFGSWDMSDSMVYGFGGTIAIGANDLDLKFGIGVPRVQQIICEKQNDE